MIHLGSTLKPSDDKDPEFETPGYDTRRSQQGIAILLSFNSMPDIMEILL